MIKNKSGEVVVALLIVIILMIAGFSVYRLYVALAIHPIPDQQNITVKQYFSKYLPVQEFSRLRWRTGRFNCTYTKMSWGSNENFSIVDSQKYVGISALKLDQYDDWYPRFSGEWRKGPLQAREPTANSPHGNFQFCLSFNFGRKPNLLAKAGNENVWFVDYTSGFILVSNSERMVEEISIELVR